MAILLVAWALRTHLIVTEYYATTRAVREVVAGVEDHYSRHGSVPVSLEAAGIRIPTVLNPENLHYAPGDGENANMGVFTLSYETGEERWWCGSTGSPVRHEVLDE